MNDLKIRYSKEYGKKQYLYKLLLFLKLMKKRLDKKGFELTISTLVIIILGILVLGVLIYGFAIGWGNFWNKVTGYSGGKDNVQAVIQACEIACSNNQYYDFCNLERKLVEKGNENNVTCENLVEKDYLSCNIKC